MTRPPQKWRAAVALVAAYALALHAFLIGFAPVQAGPAAFGAAHVLCLPSGEAPDLPAAPSGHHRDGCCVLCTHGLAPSAVSPEIGPAGYAAAALAPHVAARPPGRTGHTPVNPRAPPRAA